MDDLPGKLHFSPRNILSFFLLQLLRPREATMAQADQPEGMSDENNFDLTSTERRGAATRLRSIIHATTIHDP